MNSTRSNSSVSHPARSQHPGTPPTQRSSAPANTGHGIPSAVQPPANRRAHDLPIGFQRSLRGRVLTSRPLLQSSLPEADPTDLIREGSDWVIDLDVRAFFDSVDHSLMLKAVERHTDQKWILLYVRRWLTAPLLQPDGSLVARDRGTPQGSAISPVLANLYLHYAFDMWLTRTFPAVTFERYCDDAVPRTLREVPM